MVDRNQTYLPLSNKEVFKFVLVSTEQVQDSGENQFCIDKIL